MNDYRMDLAKEAEAASRLRKQLCEFLDEEDDKLVLDMVEGETSLVEMIVQLEESADKDDADAVYCKQRMAQIQARKIAHETRARRKREAILQAMMRAGIPKIPRPDIVISVAKGSQSVAILNPEEIPPDCLRVKHEINKEEIARRLKAGQPVPGAMLERGQDRLQVRRAT